MSEFGEGTKRPAADKTSYEFGIGFQMEDGERKRRAKGQKSSGNLQFWNLPEPCK
jgi:hypothetical protein